MAQNVTPRHTYRPRRHGRPPRPGGVTVQLPRVLVILQDGVGTDAEHVVQVDNLVPQVDTSTTVSFGEGVFRLWLVTDSCLVLEEALARHVCPFEVS